MIFRLFVLFNEIRARAGYLLWKTRARRNPPARHAVSGSGRGRLIAAGAGFAVVLIAAILVLRPWTGSSSDAGSPPDASGTQGAAPPAARLETAVPEDVGSAVNVIRMSLFAWPARGKITTYIEPGLDGIDIALDSRSDSPIWASAAGRVAIVGSQGKYGNFVIIDHGNDTTTLYGFLAKILVAEDQKLEQGGVLGLGGPTAGATAKRLHFEVRERDRPVDPLRYLPVEESPYASGGVTTSCKAAAPIAIGPASTVSLSFLSPSLTDYRIVRVSVVAAATVYFPEIDAATTGPLQVTLTVPPAPVASGATVDFALKVTFAKGGTEKSLSCPLSLTTLATLPNPPTPTPVPPSAPVERETPSPTATSTPSPKPTATATKPVKTPTKTTTPVRTATPPKK